MSDDTTEFDYVIVGAGSAGCVLAARLSEDPGIRVAILEAGGRDSHLYIKMPAGVHPIRRDHRFDWRYVTEPVESLAGRRVEWPRGKVLGGSSSINGMIYIRGNARDYDGWAQKGLRGWTYAECLPYFKRAENNRTMRDAFHSGGGPLGVSDPTSGLELFAALIKAGQEAGYPYNADFNGAKQEGIGYFQYTIKDGERCSTARAYLNPASSRANLEVIVEAHATRVVVQDKRAVGVEYLQQGERKQVHARREVICCGGTVNSPQLLELSGIGPGAELAKHGIAVVSDLPGVGENLQDHFDYHVQHECLSAATFDQYTSSQIRRAWAGLRWLVSRTGPAASMPVDAGAFLRTRPELETPDIQLQILAAFHSNQAFRIAKNVRHGFLVHVTNMRPESRGRIRLASADPFDHPLIETNYLATETDRARMRDGIKIVRGIVSQPAMDAFRGPEVQPGSVAVTDADLDASIAAHGDSDYHPVGTCKMGLDGLAVLDEVCRVRGVERLRVIDASIMPNVVTGNTNAPTIMIAEKMSDAILGKPALAPEHPENLTSYPESTDAREKQTP